MIVIIDEDKISRAALLGMLKAQKLDEYCVLVDSTKAAAALVRGQEAAPYLWVKSAEDQAFGADAVLEIKQADQFIRPLRVGQLLDRIRRYKAMKSSALSQDQRVKIGPYMLDARNNELLSGDKADGATIRLTDKETHILTFLAAHQAGGGVVDRQTLLDEVWGYAKSVETHTLETHIYRLRQKIEKDPSNPAILKTDENGYFIDIK